jgi:hypothetical protein
VTIVALNMIKLLSLYFSRIFNSKCCNVVVMLVGTGLRVMVLMSSPSTSVFA